MTNNLSERIIKKYSEDEFNKVKYIFDKLSIYYDDETIYSKSFAENIANSRERQMQVAVTMRDTRFAFASSLSLPNLMRRTMNIAS